MPASGTHASLWANSSYATTTIQGAGRVQIGDIGDNCEGWPTVDVTVAGRTTIVSATQYGTYRVGPAWPAGIHDVKIQLVRSGCRAGRSCRRSR